MGTLLGFLSSMGVGYSTQIPSADALNTMSDASEIGRKELEQMVSALQEVESGRLSEHKWMDMCGEIGFGTTRQFRRDFFRLFADSGQDVCQGVCGLLRAPPHDVAQADGCRAGQGV